MSVPPIGPQPPDGNQPFPGQPPVQQFGPGQPPGQPYGQPPYGQAGQPYGQQPQWHGQPPLQATVQQPPPGPTVRPVYSIPAAVPHVRLPVVPTPYHHFFRSPSYHWWRSFLVLGLVTVLVVVAALVITLPVVFYEIESGALTQETLSPDTLKVTPLLFAANNVILGLLIPISMFATWVCFRTRPGWLSSVVGRIRWKLLFALAGICLVPYGALTAWDLSQSMGELSWQPSSVFMIATILLTTPFQAAGEEYGVRGVLNRAVAAWVPSRLGGLLLGGFVSAVVFMLMHGAGDLWLNIFYFMFGVIAARLAYATGGLEAPIAFHVVNNFAAEVAMPFTDISGVFDRSAGSASVGAFVTQLVVVVLAWGLMELVAWRMRVTRESVPSTGGLPV